MGMVYRIGSFNLRGLREDENKNQDFDIIARIIKGDVPIDAHATRTKATKEREKSKPFHIVAIQEAVDEKQFMDFVRYRLGFGWGGVWCKPSSFSNSASKGYGYVWQTRYARLMDGEGDKGELFEPHELRWDDSKCEMRLSETSISSLTRRPFYARFRLKNGEQDLNTELRLLNTHITFGRSKSMPAEIMEASDVQQRNKEVRILTNIVYPAIDASVYKNGLNNHYTILLGDYNLNLDRPHTKALRRYTKVLERHPEIVRSQHHAAIRHALYEALPKLDDSSAIYESSDKKHKVVTKQDGLTTLRNDTSVEIIEKRIIDEIKKRGGFLDEGTKTWIRAIAETASKEYKQYKSNYDHMSYDEKRFEGVSIKIKRCDDIIEQFFAEEEDKYAAYKSVVSDHIPIVAEIDLRNGR